MGKINLKGLKAYGYHGCLDIEKQEGQQFSVDLELDVDFGQAAKTDSLEDTLDYVAVHHAVKELVEKTRFDLLEALTSHMVDVLLDRFDRIASIRLSVSKPNAPMPDVFESVSVEQYRER